MQYSKARYEALQEQLDKLQQDLAFDIAGLKKDKAVKESSGLRQSFEQILKKKATQDIDEMVLSKLDQMKLDLELFKQDLLKHERV